MLYNDEQAVYSLGGVDQTSRVEMAKKEFKPMYLIKMYEKDLTKLEMSFNGESLGLKIPVHHSLMSLQPQITNLNFLPMYLWIMPFSRLSFSTRIEMAISGR